MFTTWVVAIGLGASVLLIALAARPASARALQERGNDFARNHRVYVEPRLTPVVDDFFRSDRRVQLMTSAAAFLVLSALAGVAPRVPGDLQTVELCAMVLIAVAALGWRANRVRLTCRDHSVPVPVSSFVRPALRLLDASLWLASAALTVWVAVSPGEFADRATMTFAATPMLLVSVAEASAHALARHSQDPSVVVAYLHDARRSDAITQLFEAVPLISLIGLNIALMEQGVSEAAFATICVVFGFLVLFLALGRRNRLHFRRTLWPRLAPDEIVTSATR